MVFCSVVVRLLVIKMATIFFVGFLCFYLIKCYKRPAMNRFPVFDIWIQAKLQRDKFVRFNWMNWLNNWRLLTAIASGLILHRHSMKLVCFNTISCESLKLVKQNAKWQHSSSSNRMCLHVAKIPASFIHWKNSTYRCLRVQCMRISWNYLRHLRWLYFDFTFVVFSFFIIISLCWVCLFLSIFKRLDKQPICIKKINFLSIFATLIHLLLLLSVAESLHVTFSI